MSVACANVLGAFHQARALERAVRDAPLRRPRVRCPSQSPGTTMSSLALERWTLSKCLTKTFGPGVLAPVVDADFTFIVGRHVITGTGVVIRQSDVSFTVLEDDVDGIGSSNEVIAATASLSTLPLGAGEFPITDIAPLGSDAAVGQIDGWLEVDTPVQGGSVVCRDRPAILAIGALVDVVMRAPGYHPDADPKRAVYRYASPCPGVFVGAAVPLKLGPYRPPVSREPVAPATKECTATTCSMVLRGGTSTTPIHFPRGENSIASAMPIGDVNGDGVDDYVVCYNDAGGGYEALYLSIEGHHVVVAKVEFTS